MTTHADTINDESSLATRTRPGVLRYITYPTILLANVAFVGATWHDGGSLAGATFIALLSSIVVLMALEWLMPYRREWHPDKKEGLRDLIYFGLNGGIDALAKLGVAVFLASLWTWENGLPIYIALPAAILLADFCGYWLHRWGHFGWLWKVHGVHHTPDKVNTWNNNTIHFINSAYSVFGKLLPLVVLGFSPDVVVVAAFALGLQSFAVHANIDVELGWLGYVIMSPVHHRLHHSTVVAEAGNFASATTVWDIVFGSFVYGRRPRSIGVEKPETFPAPLDIIGNQLHPFVDQSQR